MSKRTKSPSPAHIAPETEHEPMDEGVEDDVEFSATSLGSGRKTYLERVARFLVNIQSAGFSARAARNGYDAAAHAEGWRLYNKAAGADRPLEHWFGEQAQMEDTSGLTGDRLRLLTDIDAIENTWFPRVRAIIRRVVPRESRESFAAAFFSNLEQQPLGPAVVTSVGTLLQRIEGLEKSKEPGAKEVLATLRARGLTPSKVVWIRGLLKEAESVAPRPARKIALTQAELTRAQTEQEEAFEDLRDWFNDWATHLRTVFNVRHQIVLGLAVRGGRGSGSDAAVVGEGEGDNSGSAPQKAVDPALAATKKPAPTVTSPR
ncbi:MAG: hypothetical protein U0441_22200 [Polyangiaceae bacterium]